MTTPILPPIRETVAVCDPNSPQHAIAPNSDGSINVNVTGGTGGTVTANQGTAGASAWPIKIDQTTPGTTNGVQVNAAIPAGSNIIGKVSIDQTTPGTTNGVQVNAAIPSGANIIGKTGIDQTTPGTTNGVEGPVANAATYAAHNPNMIGYWDGTNIRNAGTVNQIVAAGTNLGASGGFAQATTNPGSYGNGDWHSTQTSRDGSIFVEEGGRLFNNITTATTTTVKSGKGFFHAIVINTPVASATITIYDSLTASGTKIATITLPSVVTSSMPQTIIYDATFSTGLTVVTSGATDQTVTYR